MEPTQERILYLFQRHMAGELSPAEQTEFFELVNAGENDQVIQELMQAAWSRYAPQTEAPREWSRKVLEEIVAANATADNTVIYPLRDRVYLLKTRWFRYAAVIVLVAGTGFYLYFNKPAKTTAVAQQQEKSPAMDIPPGKTGALLKLADGSVVALDSLNNGVVASQNGAVIVLNNGLLKYNPSKETGTLAYNTITTPRGRQFHLILPDGSKVWLNAASSLTFPTAFEKKERKVSITGEAYFEIAPDKTSPFRLSVDGMQVDVLGTSFNVNAYEDEGVIKTTLLDGSIRVINNYPPAGKQGEGGTDHRNPAPADGKNQAYQLNPGQQAQLREEGLSVKNNADIEKVMAWKNGLFDFQDAALGEVMRQLARWYNIEVEYENGIPDIVFGGRLGRDVSFSKMLVFFRESGIQFSMEEENRLVIRNK